MLESAEVKKGQKERLKQEYESLNPAQLKREITRLQNELIELAAKKREAQSELPAPQKKKVRQPPSKPQRTPPANHPWRGFVFGKNAADKPAADKPTKRG